jgi:hypothetical protein
VSELRAEAADYPALRSLEILASWLAEWQRPSCDATSILSAVASLEDVIAPAAQDEALERDYRCFNGACEWANTAAADLPAWFPAWYVLEHPAAAGDFDPSQTSMAPPVRTARLVARIPELERRGDWKPLVALRFDAGNEQMIAYSRACQERMTPESLAMPCSVKA